jgi:Spy/CpxP family protein refolding chaperone
MKLTKEQINQMNELFKEGKTYVEISKIMNINPSIVNYHLNPDQRNKQIERQRNYYNSLTKEQKHKLYLNKKEYMSNWFKNKYHSDEEFRKKHIERAKRNKKHG